MSTNVYVKATRNVTFTKKNGKQGTDVQTTEFATYQTPTKVTLEVLSKANQEEKLDCYIKWAQQSSANRCASESDRAENVRATKQHVNELREFVRVSEEDGYTVEFYSI
jgi:hypothetical protein